MKVTETLRIRQHDKLNVVLEEYTTGINPKTKEESSSWKTVGYYRNTRSALKSILDRDLLINLDECEDVRRYVKMFKKANDYICNLLEVE